MNKGRDYTMLQPLNNYIYVHLNEQEEKSSGGLIVVRESNFVTAKILKTHLKDSEYNDGETIMFARKALIKADVNNSVVYLVKEDDVIAKIV